MQRILSSVVARAGAKRTKIPYQGVATPPFTDHGGMRFEFYKLSHTTLKVSVVNATSCLVRRLNSQVDTDSKTKYDEYLLKSAQTIGQARKLKRQLVSLYKDNKQRNRFDHIFLTVCARQGGLTAAEKQINGMRNVGETITATTYGLLFMAAEKFVQNETKEAPKAISVLQEAFKYMSGADIIPTTKHFNLFLSCIQHDDRADELAQNVLVQMENLDVQPDRETFLKLLICCSISCQKAKKKRKS